MVRAMVIEPGKQAEVRFIDMDFVEKTLGKDFEVVHPFDDGIAVLVDAEGKIKGLPLNRSWLDESGHLADVFAGTMVIFDVETGGLSDGQVCDLLDYFGEVETEEDWEDDDPLDRLISLLEKVFS